MSNRNVPILTGVKFGVNVRVSTPPPEIARMSPDFPKFSCKIKNRPKRYN